MSALKRDMWRALSRTVGAKLYSLAIGVLTLTLTARWLGPEGRGEYAAALAWVATFVGIAHCSLAEVASQRLSGLAHEQRFRAVAMALVYACLALTVLAWVSAAVLWHLRQDMFGQLSAGLLALAFAYVPWMIWEIYGTALLIMSERIVLANISLVLGRTLSIVCVLLAVGVWDLGVTGVLLAGLAGQVLVSSGAIWLVWQRCARHLPSWPAIRAEFKPLLSGSARLHLNALGAMLLGSTSVLIINARLGAEATGQFQLAQQLIGVLLVAAQAAMQLLYGRLGAVGVDATWEIQRWMIFRVVGLTVLAGTVAALLAPWWLVWVAGPGFEDAVALFQMLVPGLIATSFATLMTPQWIGRGLFLTVSMTAIATGGLHLAAAWFWVSAQGVHGAIYAQWLAQGLSLAVNLVMYVYCERGWRRHARAAAGQVGG